MGRAKTSYFRFRRELRAGLVGRPSREF